VPPSPKIQLNEKEPTPPLVFAVKVTGDVASGVAGVKEKLTVGVEATVIV